MASVYPLLFDYIYHNERNTFDLFLGREYWLVFLYLDFLNHDDSNGPDMPRKWAKILFHLWHHFLVADMFLLLAATSNFTGEKHAECVWKLVYKYIWILHVLCRLLLSLQQTKTVIAVNYYSVSTRSDFCLFLWHIVRDKNLKICGFIGSYFFWLNFSLHLTADFGHFFHPKWVDTRLKESSRAVIWSPSRRRHRSGRGDICGSEWHSGRSHFRRAQDWILQQSSWSIIQYGNECPFHLRKKV